MLAVALGALKTALDTRSAWYLETETLWVLATSCIGGVVLLGIVLLTWVRLIPPRETRQVLAGAPPPKLDILGKYPRPATNEDVDELLRSLETIAGAGEKETRPTEEPAVAGSAGGTLAGLVASRPLASRRILRSLLGPAIASAVFSGLSAAMLPGAGGMLQNYYTMNTFLILTLAYGWGGLVAYASASMFVAAYEA